ncbi:MAG: hypothetical protein ACI4R9_03200 [Kiritimatiellia bacterium]
MVILQFNKLIRNKWVWGAFAVVVSAAFCSDGCFRDTKAEVDARDYGTLGGVPVDAELFDLCRADIEFWFNRSHRELPSAADLNKQAWKLYAAQKVAAENGIVVSDASVARYAGDFLRLHGAPADLDAASFEKTVRNGLRMTVARYEDFCRRALIAQAVGLEGYPPVGARKPKETDREYYAYMMYLYGSPYDPNSLSVRALDQMRGVADAEVWVSPMEVEQTAYDETDAFTVRVANFEQTKEEAAAVKVDDAKLRAWYDKNSETIKLPDLRQIKFVKFDVANAEAIAKAEVPEKDIQDYYDQHITKYTTVGTNGTDKVTKPIEDVQDEIKKVLGQKKIVGDFKKMMINQVFAPLADGETADARLAALAKPGNRKVETSGWFSMDNEYVEGFMVRRSSIAPGVTDLTAGLSQLKLKSKDPLDRFAVVSSDTSVFVLEVVAEKKSHVPSFDEAKDKIGDRVLKAEQEAAFKAKVDAVIAKGRDAVLATSDVSTNLTFTARDYSVSTPAVRAAAQALKKGDVSEFIPTGAGKASVVVCIDRTPGNPIAVLGATDHARMNREFEIRSMRQTAANGWGEAYLDRVGYVPSRQNMVLRSSAKDE